MAVTIHVNGKANTLVHKGSTGIAKSTVPDVCKTPSPGGPVPIPYPIIISMSSDLKKGTKSVKVDGKNPAAVKGSEFSRCTGDEPGTAGGVKSSTNMKEATWILYSFDVKLDGKNACRLSDKMMMNHGNTACLAGEIQAALKLSDLEFKKLCEDCLKVAKNSAAFDAKMQQEYAATIDDPKVKTIADMQSAVLNSLKKQSIGVSVGGKSDGKKSTVKKQKGPCGNLKELKTARHEAVHNKRGAKLAEKHGGYDTPAWKAAWNNAQGGDGAALDEVKAHGVGRETMEKFIKECEGSG